MSAEKNISEKYPYKDNYIEVHGDKIHYIEEGSGDPILFVHGNPTWSYIWRNIIPRLRNRGRCIALDLIGMGRSGKPNIEYSFFDHVKYFEGFIEKMGLKNITLVLHDWGSALGFHYAMRNEQNIKGIAFMEGFVKPYPSWDLFPSEFVNLFKKFRSPDIGWDMIVEKNMFLEEIMPKAIIRTLTKEEVDFYMEPFKDENSRKPIWRWVNEIPIEGEPFNVMEAVASYSQKLQLSELPKLLFYATPGAIMPEQVVDWCRQNLKNLETVDIGRGIHYLQEDNPDIIGSELADWFSSLRKIPAYV
jgi:haloalkane dehalogenase